MCNRHIGPLHTRMNHDDARAAIRHGAIAGLVAAAMTAAAAASGSAGAGGFRGVLADPRLVLEVALMLGLAWGVHRRARTAAVLLLLTFVAARIALALDTGRVPFPVLTLLLVGFQARAIWGAVVHHRLRRRADPGHRPGWVRPALLGAPVAILVALGLVASVLTWMGQMLPGRVQDGTELAVPVRAQLHQLGLLDADERIAWFFGLGWRSVAEGGHLLTDRRVLAWWPVDQELQRYEIALEDLRYVELEQPASIFQPAVYRVGSDHTRDSFPLVLSPRRGGDQRFIGALRDRVATNHGLSPVR
jgi:hypothetical protein